MTTRARCKHRLARRVNGIPPPTTLREPLTADHKILNLDDETITGTLSSYKTRVIHRKVKMHKKQHFV